MSKETASIPKPAKLRSRKGTIKQNKAIAILAENGGNVSRAMIEAGYSEQTAKTPQKLTESVAYKSLAERIPDDLLETVHLEGLSASRTFGEIVEPDYAVRHKYLDSAYKLKGSYAAEKHISINAQFNIENKEQVEGIALKVLEQMKNDETV